MKELEMFFKNIERIANALENTNAQSQMLNAVNQTTNFVNGSAVSVAQPENSAPFVNNNTSGTIPVSNDTVSYTRDQISLAMGHAMTSNPNMQAQFSAVLAEFGVQTLMQVPDAQLNNLAFKLKTMGVEV